MPTKLSDLANPVRFGVPDIDPEIRKIAEDAAQGLKYSFVAAAANQEASFPSGSVEEEFRRAILTRSPELRQAFTTKARQAADAPAATRQKTFGRYGSVAVDEHASKGFVKRLGQLPRIRLDAGKLTPLIDALKANIVAPAKEAMKGAAGKITLPPFDHVTGLGFYITEVKCVDETDGFLGTEAGDDEILMGGLAVDRGDTKKVSPFVIGKEFDDGEKVTFAAPGRLFHNFPVAKEGKYPKFYSAIVILAEEDWGGFAAGISAAFAMVFPVIKDAYEEAIGVVLDSMTPIPSEVADKIGEIYVDVIGWIVDGVVGFIVDIFADDIFMPGFSVGSLHSPLGPSYAKGNGWTNYASQIGTFTFKGHGGKYTVKCYWKVQTGQ